MNGKEKRNKTMAKKKLPKETVAKARDLEVKWSLPRPTALLIAQGKQDLTEVLRKIQLKEKVARLMEKGEVLPALGPQVVAGRWTLERALFHTRLRARKGAPDYMRCFLDEYARDQRPTALSLVGGELVQGTVVESRPFDLTFRPRDSSDETTILKHDIKFFFDATRRKHLLKAIKWGTGETAVTPDHLRRIGARTDIKARILLEMQESERAVEWQTLEGDTIRGRITWFGRYEVQLQTAKGDVIAMRHAVASLI